MTNTKHTPAPWRFYKATTQNRYEVVTEAINPLMPPDCKTPLAHIASVYFAHFDGCGATKEQAEANASLIAAAPDLLEALKAVMMKLKSNTLINERDVRFLTEAAEIAIAKAEGREVA